MSTFDLDQNVNNSNNRKKKNSVLTSFICIPSYWAKSICYYTQAYNNYDQINIKRSASELKKIRKLIIYNLKERINMNSKNSSIKEINKFILYFSNERNGNNKNINNERNGNNRNINNEGDYFHKIIHNISNVLCIYINVNINTMITYWSNFLWHLLDKIQNINKNLYHNKRRHFTNESTNNPEKALGIWLENRIMEIEVKNVKQYY